MKNRLGYILILAAIAALLQGCGILRSPPKEVRLYTLTYPPAENSKIETRHGAVLRLEPLRAADPYRTDRIVYAENKYSRNSYVYHKWAAKPADMVGDLIMRDIRASQIAEAVVELPHPSFTHTLHANIDAFYEDDSVDPWQAVLQITVTLAEASRPDTVGAVLMHKTYRSEQTMKQNNPLGLAEAMSTALQEVSSELISDISGQL
ncbi:MAG: ABC-type transport auxiliary lipoprotein family protein [Desulfobacterales bacterium]